MSIFHLFEALRDSTVNDLVTAPKSTTEDLNLLEVREGKELTSFGNPLA
jgi:hypothetical protein